MFKSSKLSSGRRQPIKGRVHGEKAAWLKVENHSRTCSSWISLASSATHLRCLWMSFSQCTVSRCTLTRFLKGPKDCSIRLQGSDKFRNCRFCARPPGCLCSQVSNVVKGSSAILDRTAWIRRARSSLSRMQDQHRTQHLMLLVFFFVCVSFLAHSLSPPSLLSWVRNWGG